MSFLILTLFFCVSYPIEEEIWIRPNIDFLELLPEDGGWLLEDELVGDVGRQETFDGFYFNYW